MVEEWKDIKEYIGLYQVSNFGRVISLKYGKPKVLKSKKTRGYLRVGLSKDGKVKHFYIHRLVWESFIGEIPYGYEVNHISEDKTENFVFISPDGSVDLQKSNLNLMLHKDNVRWGTAIQRRAVKRSEPVLQLTPNYELVKEWPSMREAHRNGFKQSNISACCNGKLKQYKGCIWIKKEPVVQTGS